MEEKIGLRVKQARLDAGLTQEELAEHVGITARYIMAIENENKQPSLDILCKIIRTLRIPADSIFFPENEYTVNEKEQLTRMIYMFNERDLQVVTATLKALLETK